MIKMSAEGSQEIFLKRKYLPLITGFNLTKWHVPFLYPNGISGSSVQKVAGIFWIIAGAIVFSQEKTHAAVSSLPIQRAPVLLLAAGIFAILVGCVGCYCSRKPDLDDIKKPLITLFIVLLALAFIIALVAGIFGMIYLKRLNEFEADFKKKIGEYGITGHYKMLVKIDRVQKEDKCCGVINYVDWRNTIYSGHRYDKVPDSCCKQEEHACGFEFELSKINHRGCSAIAVDKMTIHMRLVGFGGIILGVFEAILCISFVCCYLREMCCRRPNNARVEVSYHRKTDSTFEQVLEGPDGTDTAEKPSPEGPNAPSPEATPERVTSPQGQLPPLKKIAKTPIDR